MWKICICDDNKAALKSMKEQILRIIGRDFSTENFSITTYNTGVMLTGDVEDGEFQPDVIFMDIKLADGNGIQVARNLLRFLPSAQIIFVSGYDDYYLDVYEVEHIYFIKKPLQDDIVSKALSRALDKIEKDRDDIFGFTSNSRTTLMPLKQIMYFEKEKRKILVYTVDGKCHEYYGKMEELLTQLNESFIRCHNSYVINISKIIGLQRDKFLVSGDREIPISRHYYKEAKQKFMDHVEANF